ncbi:MAG: hypothetical protein HY999_06830, partial [Nitrospinae bacterium]|nr:hypothetical protein [Nitrospinota bacterium]
IKIKIVENDTETINLPGSDFLVTDLNPAVGDQISLDTLISSLNGGQGLTLGTIRIINGALTGDIDLSSAVDVGDILGNINSSGLNVTASIDSSNLGLDVTSDPNTTTTAIVTDITGTSTSDLGIQGSQNILKTLKAFIEALDKGDRTAVRNILNHLDTGLDKILEGQGESGARVNRLERTNEVLLDMQLNVTTLLSKTEDADMLKVVTDLTTAENIFEATLAATARVMQLNLLDFL